MGMNVGANNSTEKRSVFISHRHDDNEIANILRRFVERVSAGQIDVFQSSYEGSGPEIGAVLSEDLGKRLRRAEVVIVIYTIADANWSYCMWETGVAFNPSNFDTRIVVLQCGNAAPTPLSDRVRVQVNDETSLGQFVTQLMTSPDFFPRHGQPLTEFNPSHDAIQQAISELSSQFAEVIFSEPDESWPTWPQLVFRFPIQLEDNLNNLVNAEEIESIHELILNQCTLLSWDDYAPRLFGWPSFSKGSTLREVFSRMPDMDKNPPWLISLIDQLSKGITWDFPKCPGHTLQHRRDGNYHVPMLTHVTKSQQKRIFELQVLFPEINIRGK